MKNIDITKMIQNLNPVFSYPDNLPGTFQIKPLSSLTLQRLEKLKVHS